VFHSPACDRELPLPIAQSLRGAHCARQIEPQVRAGIGTACSTWATVTVPAAKRRSTMPTPHGTRRSPYCQRLTLLGLTPNSWATRCCARPSALSISWNSVVATDRSLGPYCEVPPARVHARELTTSTGCSPIDRGRAQNSTPARLGAAHARISPGHVLCKWKGRPRPGAHQPRFTRGTAARSVGGARRHNKNAAWGDRLGAADRLCSTQSCRRRPGRAL